MRKLIFCFLFFVFDCVCFSQTDTTKVQAKNKNKYFQGIVTYSVTYKGDSELVYNLKRFIGTESKVYYYKGNTIQTTNAVMGSEYILISSEKKYYLLPYFNSDSISWIETNKKDSIIEYQILNDTVEVLGIKCNILKVKTRDSLEEATAYYYYNKSFLPINPQWTKGITYLAGGFVDSIIQSYPLVNIAVIHRLSDAEIILTATSIEYKNVRGVFRQRKKEIEKRLNKKK